MDTKKQDKIDRLYMRMAFVWSENSYAIRRKVGALIVKDNSIISDGYNGTPSGFPNVCEYSIDEKFQPSNKIPEHHQRSILQNNYEQGHDIATYPYVLHAESNAIAKLARSNNSSLGATLYVTDEPCLECSKIIIQAGIRRVIYSRPYRLHQGVRLLKRANIEVKQINVNENEKENVSEEER